MRGYPSAVSTSRRRPLPRCLHALALLVLALGLLARPLMAAACDIEDARVAVASGQGIAVDSAVRDVGDDDCCAGIECGECCAPVPLGTPALARLAAYVPVSPHMLPEPSGRFEPVAYPVDSRPPIDA